MGIEIGRKRVREGLRCHPFATYIRACANPFLGSLGMDAGAP
jgi:hypothetical protein